jgi:hypothetical protein
MLNYCLRPMTCLEFAKYMFATTHKLHVECWTFKFCVVFLTNRVSLSMQRLPSHVAGTVHLMELSAQMDDVYKYPSGTKVTTQLPPTTRN